MNGSSLRVQIKEERKQARAQEAKEGPAASQGRMTAQGRGRRSAAEAAVSVVLPSIEELLKASPASRAARCTPRAADLRKARVFLHPNPNPNPNSNPNPNPNYTQQAAHFAVKPHKACRAQSHTLGVVRSCVWR